MTEYNYKDFKISFNVELDKRKNNLYIADGYICPLNDTNPSLHRKFHTEHSNKAAAKTEIKKLIENYIDFEWQEFYEIHGGAAREAR